MDRVTIDTLKTMNRFTDAGFSQYQVKAIIDTLSEVIEVMNNTLVTKADLKVEIANLKNTLMLWGISLAGVSIAILKLT